MWRRVGQLLIGLLLCSPLVRAQGVIYRSVATGKRLSGDTFVTVPLPGASVRVCTGVQTAVPCTPLAQIYGDQGMTVVSPNPLTADQNGNYFFWAQPGTYTVQIFHPLAPVSTFSIVLSPALGSTNTWTAPNTFTAPVSFSGPMTFSGSTTVQSSLTLATPNAATAAQAQNSPPLAFTGAYWNGTASASDTWTLQDVVAAGTNGSAGMVISHAGSPSNYIQLNAAVGINKVPATALDVSGGLGVSGNASIGGSLTLGTPLAVSSGGTGTSTPSLIAGSNIVVSGGWPNQTVATVSGPVFSTITLNPTGVNAVFITGSSTARISPAVRFYDAAANTERGALAEADFAGSWANQAQPGDIVLRATTGTLRLGTGVNEGLHIDQNQIVTLAHPLPVSSGGTGTATASANTIFAGPTSGAAAAPSFRSLVAADIPAGNSCAAGQYATALGAALTLSCAQVAYSQISGTPTLYYQTVQANGTSQTQRPTLNFVSGSNASVSCADDATNNRTSCTVSAVGTVTSVGLSAPSQFTVTGSPVTGSGTLTLAWASQTANTVLAGPVSGAAAAPTFRALVAADIPSGNTCPANQYATALGAALTLSCAQVAYSQISGTPTLYYQTVQANGTSQTQRPTLNLISGSNASVSCTDDAANNRTSCTVSATGGSGTVTSVGFAAPSQFTVSGSPITTSGTITLGWANQSANTVLAGPSSGSAGAPAFRALVSADIPPINLAAGGNGGVTGILPVASGGTGTSSPAIGFGNPLDFSGSAAITSLPPASSYNVGWKATLWGNSYAIGVASWTMALMTDSWVSVFSSGIAFPAGPPANNGSSVTPDSNARVSLGADGSVRAVGPLMLNNPTAATSTAAASSPTLSLTGNYWTGTASAPDTWSVQNQIASGTNGAAILTFTHTGSPNAGINLPWNSIAPCTFNAYSIGSPSDQIYCIEFEIATPASGSRWPFAITVGGGTNARYAFGVTDYGSIFWQKTAGGYGTVEFANFPDIGGNNTGTFALSGVNQSVSFGSLSASSVSIGNGTQNSANVLLSAGFGGGAINRSINIEQILNNTSSNQYIFLNGTLGSSAAVGSPTFTSAYASSFALYSDDSSFRIMAAPAGTNIVPVSAITVNNAGRVGMATSSPAYTLDVAGDIHSSSMICAGPYCSSATGRVIASGSIAEFTFVDRGATSFVEGPTNGERWVWYSSGGIARLWSGSDKLSVTPAGNMTLNGNLTVTGTLSAPGVPVVVYATPSATTNVGTGIASTTMATAGSSGNVYEVSATIVPVRAGTGCSNSEQSNVYLDIIATDARSLSSIDLQATLSWSGNGATALQAVVPATVINVAANATVSYSTTSDGATTCTTPPAYYVIPVVKKLK